MTCALYWSRILTASSRTKRQRAILKRLSKRRWSKHRMQRGRRGSCRVLLCSRLAFRRASSSTRPFRSRVSFSCSVSLCITASNPCTFLQWQRRCAHAPTAGLIPLPRSCRSRCCKCARLPQSQSILSARSVPRSLLLRRCLLSWAVPLMALQWPLRPLYIKLSRPFSTFSKSAPPGWSVGAGHRGQR